ncbi:macro domain-containing protein [Psychrobacillus sp. NEAU-3TGS]|uniref:macro domain-containing protein n=1 Tax=Psychrobacillus sp. NEAU-3TGS TaxID=2995412 RepID=UPI002496DB7D|nr:macro domain-containing protein [Psychrobacillus sp. NEAU-3TGS]MDI2587251.1 macro domain-containing protein [Psychrobacillus sp. NEAU-3TGS]
MPIEIVRNDITKMQVDVIVNATNTALQKDGGVYGAIFSAAGEEQLQAACNNIGECPVGQAVMTDGFQLQAKQIIHTVGPIWQGGTANEETLLKECYKNSLALADLQGYHSIAFPLISSGIYGYPKEEALQIAISTISAFLLEHDMHVYIVVYDKKAFGLSEKLFTSIHEYIDEHYVEENDLRFLHNRQFSNYELPQVVEAEVLQSQVFSEEAPVEKRKKRSLEDVLNQLDESFSVRLLRLIDEKEKTDVETYKRANIDRRLFSRIRNSVDYTPHKKTVIAFAIALELNLDETVDLLSKAGYTLSNSSKFDLIIKYFIEEKNFNIHEINEALFTFDQVLLGA